MHADRRTPVVLLAVLYTVSGALCLVGGRLAAAPQQPGRAEPRRSGSSRWPAGRPSWALGVRTRWWAIHAAIAFGGVLIGLLAWRSVTAVGIVGPGPGADRPRALRRRTSSRRGRPAARRSRSSSSPPPARSPPHPHGFTVPWVTAGRRHRHARPRRRAGSRRTCGTAATTDPLTGVANRRAWEAEAARNLARAQRTGEPLSFAILDLDHFKVVNDREGHGAGDALLCELTAGWSAGCARADLLGRYGGDEFVLCLPGTEEAGAWEILRQLDETHAFAWSVGVATARRGRHARHRAGPRRRPPLPAEAQRPHGLTAGYCWAANRSSSRRSTQLSAASTASAFSPLGQRSRNCGPPRARCRRPRCRSRAGRGW